MNPEGHLVAKCKNVDFCKRICYEIAKFSDGHRFQDFWLFWILFDAMFGMVWRGRWHFWCDVLNVLMPWLVLFAMIFRFVLYFLAALLVFVDAGFCSFRHDDWYFLTRCLVPFDTRAVALKTTLEGHLVTKLEYFILLRRNIKSLANSGIVSTNH